MLDGVAHLPDRTGYLWLKTRSAEAIRIRTRGLELPEGEEFREAVRSLRENPRLGGRLSRQEYDQVIEERDRLWREPQAETPLPDHFERKYREERSAWQA